MSIKAKKIVWWVVAILGGLLMLNLVYFIYGTPPNGSYRVPSVNIAMGIILLVISTRKLNKLAEKTPKDDKEKTSS